MEEDAAPLAALAPVDERFALGEGEATAEGVVAPFAATVPATPLLDEVGRFTVGDTAAASGPLKGVPGVATLAFIPVELSERDGTALVAVVGEEELTDAEEALPRPSMCGAAPALGLLAMGVETFVLRSMCSLPCTIKSLLLFFSSRVSSTARRRFQ